MRKPVVWFSLFLVGLVGLALLQPPAVAKGGNSEHPEVEPGELCIDCHRDITPEVVDEWYAGSHGMNSVKCFVCHGSTGDDFAAVPSTDGCIGCHSDQIESMARPHMTGKDCFSCHLAHLLDPHAAVTERGGGS